MRPTKIQRKSALIMRFGDDNGLFPTAAHNRNQQSAELGVTRNTLKNWIEGKQIQKSKAEILSRNLFEIVKKENPIEDLEQPSQFLKNTGVMRLGKLLGFSRSECRKIIDQEISGVMSTFSIFNTERGAANALWSELGGKDGGHYIMYRMEDTEIAQEKFPGERKVMTIPIAVRHMIDGNKKMSQGYKKIRAKAHVYSFTGAASHYFEYDGYITKKDGVGFFHWLFQSRNQTADDLLYIITEDAERVTDSHGVEKVFILGTMHTRNQDKTAVAGSWPIVMEKIDLPSIAQREKNGGASWEDFDDNDSFFMKACARLVDMSEIDATVRAQMSIANTKAKRYNFLV
ncbi:hypothetical protein [Pseudooceanicola atlanticus]|uniref:hypothetical protein n=1 Tax=Pseudooceanicola atlanticus TaxID=1461694 RepID=UPI0023534DEC|nr:hypothetical protein [Pseudooceanicola atlanticus]